LVLLCLRHFSRRSGYTNVSVTSRRRAVQDCCSIMDIKQTAEYVYLQFCSHACISYSDVPCSYRWRFAGDCSHLHLLQKTKFKPIPCKCLPYPGFFPIAPYYHPTLRNLRPSMMEFKHFCNFPNVPVHTRAPRNVKSRCFQLTVQAHC
jgi:hypothetical protein